MLRDFHGVVRLLLDSMVVHNVTVIAEMTVLDGRCSREL